MSNTVEKLSSNQVKIHFDVEPAVFEGGIVKAYNKVKNRINIPGFRRGKAPRKVIETHYGESVFYDDAFEAIFPDIYREAVEANNLEVVDRPEIEIEEIGGGKPLVFTATVYVSPDITLGQYKGVTAQKQTVDVTDDDVKAELERARERVARFVEVTDRPVKLDDQVTIDYKGICEGEAFEGGTADDYKLVIGSGSFIPGFEDQLIGANVGDDVDVNVTFPEPYQSEALAGKPAVFHVKVKEIQQKELPELDDEFAKDVSDVDTLDAYKAQIRERLEKQAEENAESAFEREVLDAVVENAEMDIPEAMIADEVSGILRNMEMRMMYQGLRMEDFYKYTGQTEEQVREMYKGEAESNVRMRLVLDAIRKAEGIEATDEETDAEIERFAGRSGQSAEEFKSHVSDEDRKYYAESAAVRKTIDMLKAEAVAE